jgi:hypothetical protein
MVSFNLVLTLEADLLFNFQGPSEPQMDPIFLPRYFFGK